MSVGEVCNREVIICRAEEPLAAAVALMRNRHVGCVVIVESGVQEPRPIGILTDRDIVIRVLAETRDLNSIRVADVMSHDLVTAKQEDTILDAIELMRDKGVRRIPILNPQGGLTGILTVDDVVELLAEQLTDLVKLCGREIQHERSRG